MARRFGLRDACRTSPTRAALLHRPAGLERKARAYAEMVRDAENACRTPAADAAPQPPVEVKDARPPIPVTDADFARLRRIKQVAYERAKAEAQDAWRNPSPLPVADDAAPPPRRMLRPLARPMTSPKDAAASGRPMTACAARMRTLGGTRRDEELDFSLAKQAMRS